MFGSPFYVNETCLLVQKTISTRNLADFKRIFHQPEILLMTEIRRSPPGIYKTL